MKREAFYPSREQIEDLMGVKLDLIHSKPSVATTPLSRLSAPLDPTQQPPKVSSSPVPAAWTKNTPGVTAETEADYTDISFTTFASLDFDDDDVSPALPEFQQDDRSASPEVQNPTSGSVLPGVHTLTSSPF